MNLLLPPVIGHRGAAGLAPENTLLSLRTAAVLGCRMVEFDVRLSADRIPIVFHDDTLERRTGAAGPVGARTLAELRRLDAGDGEAIPTLGETLRLCLELGMGANIEIKPDLGAEQVTAALALAEARTIWPADVPPPLVSSFSEIALAAAVQIAPDWPRGLLVGPVPPDWRRRADALGCAAVCVAQRRLTAATVGEIKRHGLAVLAYTVNSRGRAATLWRWGVDSVFSDRPDLLS